MVEARGLLPNTGATCGGREVTITGSGFENATFVNFGDVSIPRSDFAVNEEGTAITVKSPRHLAGEVPVTVTAGVTSPATTFTYTSSGPATIGSLSSRAGPVSGGTRVVVAGTFAAECVRSVSFGETPATFSTGPPPASGQPDTIVATSPVHDPGEVRVQVGVDPGPPVPVGTVVPSVPVPPGADAFTYHPVISGLAPPNGPTAGGNEVTIAGQGFTASSTVSFGGDQARITRRSNTELVAVAPPHATPEPVVVHVAAAGVTAVPDNLLYTYEAPLPVDPAGDPTDPGAGPPKQDAPPPDPAPPGGSPAASPPSAPSPANAPSSGLASAPTPGAATAPSPGAAPAPTPVASPTPGQAPLSAQVPGQSGSPTNSAAVLPPPVPVASPVAAPGTAVGQGGQGAPNQGLAGGGDEDEGQGAHRYAMSDSQATLALGVAGATGCFTFLAATRRQPARRRCRSSAGRPQPKGAY